MAPAPHSDRARTAWLAADALAVLVFAAVGRRSHAEAGSLVGVLATAWPFLVGTGVGWLLSRAWARPTQLLPTGVVVWLSTVAVGMVLRRLTDHGTAASFVVVALVVLGAFLLGWRALTQVVARRRTPAPGR